MNDIRCPIFVIGIVEYGSLMPKNVKKVVNKKWRSHIQIKQVYVNVPMKSYILKG